MLTFFAISDSFPFPAQLLPYTSLSLSSYCYHFHWLFVLSSRRILAQVLVFLIVLLHRNGRFEVKRFHIGQVILRSSFTVTH
ncbi:hypothetical protein AAZX31_18G078300 [Glycine max]